MSDDLLAKAMLEAVMPRYRSRAEAVWASMGRFIIENELDLEVILTRYEPLGFNLPGGRYTPDFLYIHEDGTLTLVEVKASSKQKGYRDSRAKLRAAAAVFPWCRWFMATRIPDRQGGGWKLEQINA